MTKEIDLRAEPIGTYEFPFPEEKAIDVRTPVFLRNLALSKIDSHTSTLKAKLFYTGAITYFIKHPEEQKKHCSVTFNLRGHGYEDLDSFKRLHFSGNDTAERALLRNVYCTEATEYLPPLTSKLGVDTLNYYGDNNLENTKDVNHSFEAHVLKALFIHCLAGRLYFQPSILIAKLRMPTRDGLRSEYSFNIKCGDTSEIVIALKVTEDGFLEIASIHGDEYRFIV